MALWEDRCWGKDLVPFVWIGKRPKECDEAAVYLVPGDPLPGGLRRLRRCDGGAGAGPTISADVDLAGVVQALWGRYHFIWYDELWAHLAAAIVDAPELSKDCVPAAVLTLLQNKVAFRGAVGSALPLLRGEVVSRDQLTYAGARRLFPWSSSFVVHGEVGSACGNLRLLRSAADEPWRDLLRGDQLIVTPLVEDGTPWNVHVVVGRRDFLVAPPSLQLLGVQEQAGLTYDGCDFSAASALDRRQLQAVQELGAATATWLADLGFRGVAGVDFLLEGARIHLVEVNARFQASTVLLNRALRAAGAPSCQQLQQIARRGQPLPQVVDLACRGSLVVAPGELHHNRSRTLVAHGVAQTPFGIFPRLAHGRIEASPTVPGQQRWR